ncbi:hypothetical protein [Collimonas fungivorans]|uniref:hypothetical protein n=1 Tax=Collimonas fungivorans TaxID=158899 RepID=UPI0011D23E89|nr:hypothetical protein [Collimonas fungivorans]
MNELFAKLTNLSYEIFGVFLPGMVTSMFAILLWAALGNLAPYWTHDVLPIFVLDTLRALINSLNVASGIGAGIPILGIWYFLGHIILWIGRSGKARADAMSAPFRRLGLSLIFRIPRPVEPFNTKLDPLFDLAKKNFVTDGLTMEWRQFFPVAKIFLSQRLTTSLVTTYQNKYTFHRSVVTISALLFWVSILALSCAYISVRAGAPAPYWWALFTLAVGAIIFVWNFSASYLYHWEMFGNSIVTETYSLLYAPKDASNPK